MFFQKKSSPNFTHIVLNTLVLSIFFYSSAYANVISETETLSDDLDVEINKYKNNGEYLLLWIAPSFGFRKGHEDIAALLQSRDLEVWLADLNDALFLPHNSVAMRELTGHYAAELIKRAYEITGKKIILVSGSYGAIPLLRGVNQWQISRPERRYVVGGILFSPNLYKNIPPLGTSPEYLPITHSSSIPIMIFQGSMNGNRWQLLSLVETLQIGGSSVYMEIMPDIIGLFYRKERPPNVEAYFQKMPDKFRRAISLLENSSYDLQTNTSVKFTESAGTGLDARLKAFKGNPDPIPIQLKDFSGKTYTINDYKGRVTIVNFWATWCPPCVEEIPSLNRLKAAMADKPFELISINYAEKPATIREFMQQVNVDFPVLMDKNGEESARWKVVAFPSTFIIGTDGQIHYGVNAGIEWDKPDVINTLNQLF